MALARLALIAIVAGELDDVFTLAGLTSADDAANMKGPIDATFRALGVAEASLGGASAADGSEQRAVDFATYFVLRRAVRALVRKMNVAAGGGAKANLREQFENVRDQMKDALLVAQGSGLVIGPDAVFPIAYGGGVSKGDYDANAADGDRLQPFFDRSDVAIRGVDDAIPVAEGVEW